MINTLAAEAGQRTGKAAAETNGGFPAPAAVPARAAGRRNLSRELVQALEQLILTQHWRPGDKLPTEAEIVRQFQVSRTVVREALSRLQAAGLVATRHGIGTFVLAPRPPAMFRLDPADLETSFEVLAVLELRISLETETAGLAAARRSDANLAVMRQALDDFTSNVARSETTVAPDFRFHQEIAEATGNRYFAEIINYLGTTILPRTRLPSSRIPPDQLTQYLQRVNREHEQIFDAIARRDTDFARAAMRIHLTNSRERLRRAQEVS
ncbi:FadR/GntR family transcriptional regulator [Herbaspirillum sp. WKF16]|jgi:DNA-binding FadR family transcriptional regulator|uniref:FadR/GntR family transcriptional regulator n=1 Tax=Herbaspirillum sp. WKF16 TaxID=3028312 RepID=UPI0023A9EF66|nr:FadR/GntR family transcriptional regulator [Herbaspirillum sp. WKF16]WDZ95978.1 FadR/GntR family transcriptional regulator [Herbaspirillum sp. WKF16]